VRHEFAGEARACPARREGGLPCDASVLSHKLLPKFDENRRHAVLRILAGLFNLVVVCALLAPISQVFQLALVLMSTG